MTKDQILFQSDEPVWFEVALPIISGLVLLLLLPIGLTAGIANPLFNFVFVIHVGLLIWSVSASVRTGIRLICLSPYPKLFGLWAMIGIVVIVSLSLLPISNRDALIHHLVVPKWWIEANKIVPFDWHEWSYYPMLINLGFTGLLSWKLEWLTPFYHGAFLVILCGAVGSLTGFVTKDRTIAASSYLLTLTLPICLRLATIPVVDLGLALYFAIALFTLVYWANQPEKWLWLLLSGLALGLALGSKYNGILASVVLFPGIFFLCTRSKISARSLITACLVVGITSSIVFGPWAAKNIFWTGNPIFPLHRGTFGGPTITEAVGGLSPIEQRRLLHGASWAEIAATPIMMLVAGQDDKPRFFDGVLSPILIFAFIPFLRRVRPPWLVFLGTVCLLYFAFALVFSVPRVRYLSPIYGPLIVLACQGIFLVCKTRRELFLALALHLLFLGIYITRLYTPDVVRYLTGKQSRVEYLRRQVPEFSIGEYVNENLPPDASLYLLNTGGRFYYYDRKVRSGGYHSGDQLIQWLRQEQDPNKLIQHFTDLGITHILENAPINNRALAGILTEEQLNTWKQVKINRLVLEKRIGAFILWRIMPVPD